MTEDEIKKLRNILKYVHLSPDINTYWKGFTAFCEMVKVPQPNKHEPRYFSALESKMNDLQESYDNLVQEKSYVENELKTAQDQIGTDLPPLEDADDFWGSDFDASDVLLK